MQQLPVNSACALTFLPHALFWSAITLDGANTFDEHRACAPLLELWPELLARPFVRVGTRNPLVMPLTAACMETDVVASLAVRQLLLQWRVSQLLLCLPLRLGRLAMLSSA